MGLGTQSASLPGLIFPILNSSIFNFNDLWKFTFVLNNRIVCVHVSFVVKLSHNVA